MSTLYKQRFISTASQTCLVNLRAIMPEHSFCLDARKCEKHKFNENLKLLLLSKTVYYTQINRELPGGNKKKPEQVG
jgi:hypothetical protein